MASINVWIANYVGNNSRRAQQFRHRAFRHRFGYTGSGGDSIYFPVRHRHRHLTAAHGCRNQNGNNVTRIEHPRKRSCPACQGTPAAVSILPTASLWIAPGIAGSSNPSSVGAGDGSMSPRSLQSGDDPLRQRAVTPAALSSSQMPSPSTAAEQCLDRERRR